MLVHAHGFSVNRGIAEHVDVELDARPGLPSFSVIGLGGSAGRDARERVQAAVLNSGFAFPRRRVTVNLAPSAPAVAGRAFDLALACCVLAAEGEIDGRRLTRIGLFAQLGLGGDLRGCDWVSAAAEVAEENALAGLIVARRNLKEARGASSVPVAGLANLREVGALLARPAPPRRTVSLPSAPAGSARPSHERPRGVGAARGSRHRGGASPNGASAPAREPPGEPPPSGGASSSAAPLRGAGARGSHDGGASGRPP